MIDPSLGTSVKSTATVMHGTDPEDEAEELDSIEDERGKPARQESRLERIERVFRIAGFMGVTASAILASWQYVESQAKEARAQSLGYIVQWQTGPEKEAFLRVRQRLHDLTDTSNVVATSSQPEDVRRAQSQIGHGLIGMVQSERNLDLPHNLENDIETLVDFYSQLEFCIRANICESNILSDYFATDVNDFWAYTEPYAMYRRQNLYPTFGEAVQSLSAQFTDG